MISKKICLLGAFSVGKTSLVEQFVHSIFSDKYLSTIGVKISKKVVEVDGSELTFILWDMEGKDVYAGVNLAYLRGTMGYFVVVDGMRQETLSIGLELKRLADRTSPGLPCFFLINKADLAANWEVTPAMLEKLTEAGIPFLCTSAKSGENVNEAFACLGKEMLQKK